jgi:hypothetical protein
MSFRYSFLCEAAFDTVDTVRSASPQGFKLKIKIDKKPFKEYYSFFNLKRSFQALLCAESP